LEEASLYAVGHRAGVKLRDNGFEPVRTLSLPGSVGGITWVVQELLFLLEGGSGGEGLREMYLLHHRPGSGTAGDSRFEKLYPLDRRRLEELRDTPWDSRSLPMFTMDTREILAAVVKQYLFVTLYRAIAESLAAENAQRLATMQAAERNIDDRLEELNGLYNRNRQRAVTSELLDITSGFEALSS
jgi:F-type H+-transporting ATPase subunit gamma